MTDVDDRLSRVLHGAVPVPPRELDASAIRAGATRRLRRRRMLTPLLAAAAVAAVAIGAVLAVQLPTTSHRPQPEPEHARLRPFVIPAPPGGFEAAEFRMAPPAQVQLVIGPAPPPRSTCAPAQITATAATRRTAGGVLGVVRLTGAVVAHRNGVPLRCTLPVQRGPSALLAADGRSLPVPLSAGDRTSGPGNPRPDIPINDGDAIWGFAWLGSYCGDPASAVEFPLDQGGSLRVALGGPQPSCDQAAQGSMLIDGVAGAPGEPVQPPRPDYADLRLTGRIRPGTRHGRIAPIDLTLRTVGTEPITLDPCPSYAGRDDATARSGGFGDSLDGGYLPCTDRAAVVRPGHPLHVTIPATSLLQSPGTGAKPGSTVYVQLGIAGVPILNIETTVGR